MHVVLVEPEIPQNTGSIARTCAANSIPLHLVGKLGFDLSEKRVRRAGLDYWPYVDLHQHENWDQYYSQRKQGKIWLFSKFSDKLYWSAKFESDDALVFGSETGGGSVKSLFRSLIRNVFFEYQ